MAKLSLLCLLSLSLIANYFLLHYQLPSCHGAALNEDPVTNETQSIDWNELKFHFIKCNGNPSTQFCSNYAILLVNDFPNDGKMANDVVNLYNKLIRNGFRSTNIRVFYGNGSIPKEYSKWKQIFRLV